jgi:hypothetical protein
MFTNGAYLPLEEMLLNLLHWLSKEMTNLEIGSLRIPCPLILIAMKN